jgi:hypothetical protein
MICHEGSARRVVGGAARTENQIRDLMLVAIDLNNFRLATSASQAMNYGNKEKQYACNESGTV